MVRTCITKALRNSVAQIGVDWVMIKLPSVAPSKRSPSLLTTSAIPFLILRAFFEMALNYVDTKFFLILGVDKPGADTILCVAIICAMHKYSFLDNTKFFDFRG